MLFFREFSNFDSSISKNTVMQNIEQEALRLIAMKMNEKGWNRSALASKMGVHQS
jgi:hypothetical protein